MAKVQNFNQNICLGFSKEPSQWDCSFEHSKLMLKLMDKKLFPILGLKILFIRTLAMISDIFQYMYFIDMKKKRKL